MYYSSFGILAVILHIIINSNIMRSWKKGPKEGPRFRYGQFLNSILVFYIADLLWGFLVEAKLRALAYADTVLFFAMMALSVVLWTRFVAAFLDKRGVKTKSFLAAGWLIFGFVILHLILNFFKPIIFTFTEDTGYIAETGRYYFLVAQLILFISITVYSLFVSVRSTGRDKVHYRAVCLSGGVMAMLIVLQTIEPFAPFYTIGCMLANCLIHVFVEEDQKREQIRITEDARKNSERYTQISNSLAKDYEAIYYINIENGKYFEVSASESYEAMNVPKAGEDFYTETRENAARYAHPDDRKFAVSMYYKETMLKNLEGRTSYSYKYRIMVGDEARYYRFVVLLSDDKKHFVLCDKDIQDTITAETAMLEKQKTTITFSRIAESLASNYDVIYYIDTETDEYVGYSANNIFGELTVDQSGEDFYNSARFNASILVHPQDRERFLQLVNKDYLLTTLDERKQAEIEYRHIIDNRVQHTRLSARKSSDGKHFILCVENIDDEIRKEREHLRALNTEKELARRDELTGTRNKTAFTELEQSIQENIDRGEEILPFAIVVCDLNDLKKVNDTEGHQAGDEYIRSSARLLCNIFDHSPVFRIGGDEFAIFLQGDDYDTRKELFERLRSEVRYDIEAGSSPVIAAGMAEYEPDSDMGFSAIFECADRRMYEDKKELKNSG